MDISANPGRLKVAKNLVLHLDVCHDPNGELPFWFVARVGTTNPTATPPCVDTLLYSSGTWKTWEVTPSFVTLLLGDIRDKTKFRAMLDSWILETKTMPPGAHRLCVEIRHQGEFEAPRIPTPGVGWQHPTPFVHTTPPFVVYEYVPKAHLLERGLTVDVYIDEPQGFGPFTPE